MKKIGIIIIAAMLTAFCAAASAEVTPGVYSLTPYVGYYKFEGNEGLKESYTVGLRLGLNLTENIGAESYFSWTPTEIDGGDNDSIRMWSYGIEGIYNFMPDKQLVPFVAAGVGGIYYDTVGFTEDNTNKLSLDYGGGVKYFLNDNLALRADVRHIIPVSNTYNDFLFSFGISYAFGTSRKNVASAREDYYTPPAAPVREETPVAAQEPVAPAPAPPVVQEPVAPAPAPAPEPAPVAVVPEPAPAPAEAPVTIVVDQKDEQSAAEGDIKNFVGKWRDAWQSGDMLTYRNCYAPKFNAKGKDLDQWVAYKTKLQKRSKHIRIGIEDLKITINDADTATAAFTQDYSSSVHKDSGEKILKLVKIDGQWKISDEIM